VLRIKYAFVELDNLTARGPGAIRGAQTPWLDSRRASTGIRVQGTVFAERENLIRIADFGVGLFTPVGKYIGRPGGRIQRRRLRADGYEQVQERAGAPDAAAVCRRGIANGFRLSVFYQRKAGTQRTGRGGSAS